MVKALASEIQAGEAQHRASQCRPINVLEVEATQSLNQEPLPEKVQVAEEEKSEVLRTRPCWSSKVEYILSQVGYSMKISNLWRFLLLWLHNGGCKSGDQESWIHRGL